MFEQLEKQAKLTDYKKAVQTFQQNRLKAAYDDLLTDSQYGPVAAFFFSEVYAPKDFSDRNHAVRELHHKLRGQIHDGIFKTVSDVIELHEMSEALDERMASTLRAMGAGTDFDDYDYACAYRRLDNEAERHAHLSLVLDTIRSFHELSRSWSIGLSLRAAGAAARLLGVGHIMAFIREGYNSFRAIQNIEILLQVIKAREKSWHDHFWKMAAFRSAAVSR